MYTRLGKSTSLKPIEVTIHNDNYKNSNNNCKTNKDSYFVHNSSPLNKNKKNINNNSNNYSVPLYNTHSLPKDSPSHSSNSIPFSRIKERIPIKKEEKKVKPIQKNEKQCYNSMCRSDLKPRIQCNDVFNTKYQGKSRFSSLYDAGGIPCRIYHKGSSINILKWDKPVSEYDYDPLLIIVCEGLVEDQYPFSFCARNAWQDLLSAPGSQEKTIPLLKRLLYPLKKALQIHNTNFKNFNDMCTALCQLSQCVGPSFNEFLIQILTDISKPIFFDSQFEESILNTLRVLEENGGIEASKLIKKKVPTYNSMLFN